MTLKPAREELTVADVARPAQRLTRKVPAEATYFPALDGLRAVAVLAVLLYHAGVSWMPGGFLGVSVFFTVSGFVVTRSLIARHERRQSGFYRSFYAARVRRLLPAATITLAGVVALSAFGRLELSQRELRWTVLLSNNWYQLFHGDAYAAAIGGTRSPLVHFWSLAIEEQFYLVWPIVLVGLIVRRRRPALVAAILWGVLAVATVVVGQSATQSQMYFATWWRLPEILIGCVLALLPAGVVASSFGRNPKQHGAIASVVGTAALALVVAAMMTASDAQGWTVSGGLALFALVSAVLVAAGTVDGVFARLLAVRPLVAIGQVSYGLYLFHWPVFVLIDGLVMRLAVTAGLTVVSWFAVERPLRGLSVGSRPAARAWFGSWIAVSAAVVVAAAATGIATTAERRDQYIEAAELSPATEATRTDSTLGDGGGASSAGPVNGARPTRFGVFGDSTAESLAAGIAANLVEDRETDPDSRAADVSLVSFSEGGCGIVRGGRYFEGTIDAALHMFCPGILDEQLPDAVANGSLDVVIVYVSLADTWDRSWDDKVTRLGPDDPEYRQRIVDDYRRFFADLSDNGETRIVWLRPPVPIEEGVPAASYRPGGAQDLIESTVRELADQYPIEIVDLRGCVESQPWVNDTDVRPDGIHWSIEGAQLVARTCLTDLIAS